MTLTERGLEVYQGLELVMNQLLGMHQIEKNDTVLWHSTLYRCCRR